MPFDKPYVEPEDLDVGTDTMPEDPELPEQHPVPGGSKAPEDQPTEDPKIHDQPKHLKYKTRTKTHDALKTEDRPKPAEDTTMNDPDRTYPDPEHSGPVTRSKRRRAMVLNVWDLAPSE